MHNISTHICTCTFTASVAHAHAHVLCRPQYTAKHLEPHEARVIIVDFGPPAPQSAASQHRRLQPAVAQKVGQQRGGEQLVEAAHERRHELPHVRSHRHSVHEQHAHEVRPPMLAECAHQYGGGLLVLYMASLSLAGVVVYIVRFVTRGRATQHKRSTPRRAEPYA